MKQDIQYMSVQHSVTHDTGQRCCVTLKLSISVGFVDLCHSNKYAADVLQQLPRTKASELYACSWRTPIGLYPTDLLATCSGVASYGALGHMPPGPLDFQQFHF